MKLYWRVKIDGKWTFKAVTKEEEKDLFTCPDCEEDNLSRGL